MSMDHRMHDYCLLGQRLFQAARLDPDIFTRQLDELRRSTGAEIAAGDTFVIAMRAVLEKLSKGAVAGDNLPGWKSWFPLGCAAVRADDGAMVIGIRPKKLTELVRAQPFMGGDWLPRNEREAGGALLRTIPIFSDIGVKVLKREPSKGNVYWEFNLTPRYRADGQ
jgi:hypothetical protein